MPSGLSSNPFFQKLSISELPGIRYLGYGLCLPTVKAQKRGNAGDHVSHGQVRVSRHDIWRIKLDLNEGHSAFVLANARLDEMTDQRANDFASRAPGGGPESQQGGAGRG
jgi:hypothetical protein